ncbi:MAG: DUF4198 domain-containing protein, partial [Myxococcota bacterium]
MLTLWLAVSAQAHDYLLAAEPPRRAGTTYTIHGVVAHARKREERRERPETLSRLDQVSRAGSEPLDADGHGWGRVDLPTDEVMAVVYENSGATVELEWPRFRAYVAKEGDPRVLDVVDALGPETQHEHYRRSIKLLLGVAEGRPGWDRVVGQPLELVPLDRPGSVATMRVRLLAEGMPVTGAKVRAYPYGGHSEKHTVSALTDEDGVATLRLSPKSDDWVYAAVTMTHDPDRAIPWSSVWTSLRVVELEWPRFRAYVAKEGDPRVLDVVD